MTTKEVGLVQIHYSTDRQKNQIKERLNGKSMLFEKECRELEDKLYEKGYYVANMTHDNSLYELYDKDGKVLIDYLSFAQLEQLANML